MPSSQAHPVLIAISTYNEAENIPLLLNGLLELYVNECDILVVDDNSPDGTAEKVRDFAKKYPQISLLVRTKDKGRGLASRAAYDWFMERSYTHLIELDGDLSHDYKDIRFMLDHRNDAPLIVGSRHIKGGSFGNYPWYRVWMSSAANAFVRLVLGLKIHDTTNSFLCFSREVFEKLSPKDFVSSNFSLFMEIKCLCEQHNIAMLEFPITIKDREYGETKMAFIQVLHLFKVALDLRKKLNSKKKRS